MTLIRNSLVHLHDEARNVILLVLLFLAILLLLLLEQVNYKGQKSHKSCGKNRLNKDKLVQNIIPPTSSTLNIERQNHKKLIQIHIMWQSLLCNYHSLYLFFCHLLPTPQLSSIHARDLQAPHLFLIIPSSSDDVLVSESLEVMGCNIISIF